MKPKSLLQKKEKSDEGVELLARDTEVSEPLTLVLLGHTGVGKSASGNTILQSDAFESRRTFRSVTMEISERGGAVGRWEVRVVDTPGIMDPEKDRDIRSYCEELRRSGRPHVFLFVLKIDRFTAEQQEALQRAMRAAGDRDQSTGLLLFTGADSLGGMTLEEFIHEDPQNPLVSVAQTFGDRIHMFHNKNQEKNQERNQENQQQVVELMEKIRRMRHERPQTQRNRGSLEEVRLVLLGLPRIGKSSAGNTILGSAVFQPGCDFEPVTKATVSSSAVVLGRRVTVVDTPGITDEALTPKQLFEQIVLSIREAAPGPHAFVFVVRLGSYVSSANAQLLQMLPKMFDCDVAKFCLVLFTFGDLLNGQSVSNLMENNKVVRNLVSKCGGRYSVFNNNQRERGQVQSLLRLVETMIRNNEQQHYTSAMFSDVHFLSVHISIKWHDLRDWFLQLLKNIRKMISSNEKATQGARFVL